MSEARLDVVKAIRLLTDRHGHRDGRHLAYYVTSIDFYAQDVAEDDDDREDAEDDARADDLVEHICTGNLSSHGCRVEPHEWHPFFQEGFIYHLYSIYLTLIC